MAFTTSVSKISVSCLLIVFVNLSLGCSPIPGEKEDSLEKKFFHSDNVVYGKILAHYKEAKPMYDTVYIAEMEVYCTFKGIALPRKINISDAGIVPGLCHSTNLTIGHEYTLFLDSMENKFKPVYKEHVFDEQYLDEISILCDHAINYPIGLNESTSEVQCPLTYDYDECVGYSPEDDKETQSNDIEVKTLTTGATAIVEVDDNAEPSKGGNGSDVSRLSSVLTFVCFVVLTFVL